MRPQSIKLFDLFYLGALALGLLNLALQWEAHLAWFLAQPGAEALGAGFFIATIAIFYLLVLALWFFTSRMGSNVAKWLTIVVLAINVALSVPGLAAAGVDGIVAIIGMAIAALQAAALVMLFRPDARAWFAARGHDDDAGPAL